MSEDRLLTDDIVQNVFIKMYQNFNLIRNKQSIQFWLFKTARNEFYGLFRSAKLKKLYSEADEYDKERISIFFKRNK